MNDHSKICAETGCHARAVILIGGPAYCAEHALRKIGGVIPKRAERSGGRSKRRKQLHPIQETLEQP